MMIYHINNDMFQRMLHGNRSLPIFDQNMQNGDTLYAYNQYWIKASITKISRNHGTLKTKSATRFQPTNHQMLIGMIDVTTKYN